jgi:hypothetical protein
MERKRKGSPAADEGVDQEANVEVDDEGEAGGGEGRRPRGGIGTSIQFSSPGLESLPLPPILPSLSFLLPFGTLPATSQQLKDKLTVALARPTYATEARVWTDIHEGMKLSRRT